MKYIPVTLASVAITLVIFCLIFAFSPSPQGVDGAKAPPETEARLKVIAEVPVALQVGDLVSETEFQDTRDGRACKLSDWKGQVVLVGLFFEH